MSSKIDLVIFDFPWGLPAMEEFPHIPSIYFSNGVEKDFASITLKHLGLEWFPWNRLLPAVLGHIERQACVLAKLTVCMNEKDASRFTEIYAMPSEKFQALGQPHTPYVSEDSKEALRAKLGLPVSATLVVFHGSASHFPNREAITCLRQYIAVSFESDARVYFVIAGTGQPEFVEKNIISLGYVEELEELLVACDIALVPIFSACGMQMKLFDYFRCGVPVVATDCIAEGLDGYKLCVLSGGDSPTTMTGALKRMLDSSELQAKFREQALACIASRAEVSQMRTEFSELLISLVKES
jgi:hypothetical protein